MPVSEQLAPVEQAYLAAQQYVSPVGLAPAVREQLGEAEVGVLLTFSGTLEDISKWVVTDLLLWGEDRAAQVTGQRSGREFWRERDRIWEQILRACKLEIGKHTAYNMAACGRAWPFKRRRHTERISYEHHRVLASRGEEEQERWLDLAEAGEWSVSRLRAALYSGEEDPLLPHANMTVLPRVELWPTARIEEELARRTAYIDSDLVRISEVVDLVLTIKGDYEREYKERTQPAGH